MILEFNDTPEGLVVDVEVIAGEHELHAQQRQQQQQQQAQQEG
jgi:hypothetical protein